ncbi:MAG: LuxR family transcriptional regulator [Mesorhizobium sp.]|uniref:LuxR family transcriptional regulator n=1 Tax=Mesorhizobium sp. TaxID=1871066 RepID=UPI000FE4CAEB|nr:LuxR family transcriptional regulator [Mesorhizobium sp.]RWM87064.1 MAG: LuxR family transcriptional regulator [Mesorhizobium sp.]
MEQDEALCAGQAALLRAAWPEARAYFEAALARGETPEALEGLGAAAWWLSDVSTVFATRERAYRLYRENKEARGAARVAAALAIDYCTFQGKAAIASGWIRRAERLLGDEACRELGWLLIVKTHMALMIDHDPATAQGFAIGAGSLGRTLDDVDLEMLALAYEGLALVSLGQVDKGMRCLDEATTAAVVGEMSDIDATCTACCCLIYACEKARDLERAAEWCAQLKERSLRSSYRLMFALCRAHYAGVLIWRGDWAEAEAELIDVIGELERTHRAQAAEALVLLAELRLRQGRLDEASALLERAQSPPYQMFVGTRCLLSRTAIALDLGNPVAGLDHVQRFLRAVPAGNLLERAAGLELLVRAHAMLGDCREAEAALRELQGVVSNVSTGAMKAAVRFAEGRVAAMSDPLVAKAHFEDAAELFAYSGAPFESAEARVELGRLLSALGRRATAVDEILTAARTFGAIGAAAEARKAQSLARELRSSGGKRAHPLHGLTKRELEVLALIAEGLTNREVATRLCRSEHTVHRHVANILGKLGLSSRAAAASFAAKYGPL